MGVTEFYADEHLGMKYGTVHSGQDVNRWAPGTLIPSPVAGRVAKKGKSLRYGFWVAVKLSDGTYLGAAHMLTASPLEVGQPVQVNTTLGLLGNTGSYSRGPHTHIYHSTVPEPWGRPTTDPLPIIKTARTNQGDDMPKIIYDTTNNKYWLVGETTALELSASVATKEAAVWGNAISVDGSYATQIVTCAASARAILASAFTGGTYVDADHVDDGELGQALTATVSLVNAQATVNKDEILTAINSLTLSAG